MTGLLEGHSDVMASWFPAETPGVEQHVLKIDPSCALVRMKDVLRETEAMLTGAGRNVEWRPKVLMDIEDLLAL